MFGQNAQMPNLQNQETSGRKDKKFTKEEDEIIIGCVQQCGRNKNAWQMAANSLETRTPKQCKDRYYNYLKPDVIRRSWTEEEDNLLKGCVDKHGKCFSLFADKFPGRNQHQLRGHYLRISNRTKDKHKNENDSKFDALSEETKSDIANSLTKEGSYTNFSQETKDAIKQSGMSTTYLADKFGLGSDNDRRRLGEFLNKTDPLARAFGPTKASEMIADGYKPSRKISKKTPPPVPTEKLNWYNQGQQNQPAQPMLPPQPTQQFPQEQPLNQDSNSQDVTLHNPQQKIQLPPISTIMEHLYRLTSTQQEFDSTFSFPQSPVQQTNTNQNTSVLLNSVENDVDNLFGNLNNNLETEQNTNNFGGIGK